jgi:hypothetical protein
MIWSNWRKAIWRGAAVAVLFWAGLAWTQTTPPTNDPGERIMRVQENGKETRCRVLESWQMPDGRLAHLLQSLDSGEKITIVDEMAAVPGVTYPRGIPKRIFNWGAGRRTPPEGSPIPPHMRLDSGVVVKSETPPPAGATPTEGNTTVVHRLDETALINPIPVVDFNPQGAKAIPVAMTPMKSDAPVIQPVSDPAPGAPVVLPPQPIGGNPPPTSTVICDPGTIECPSERTGWRPGALIGSWLQNRQATTVAAPPPLPPEPVKTESAKSPFNTAAPQMPLADSSKPEPGPLAIPKESGPITEVKPLAKPDIWGTGAPIAPTPAKTLPEVKPDLVKLPEPPATLPAKIDPLTAPERLISEDKLKAKTPMLPAPKDLPMPAAPDVLHHGWPMGTQSVAAAKSGLVGPVTFVPVPMMTVPQPSSPPMPPPPVLPEAPNPNAYVNAFTPPPAPKQAQPPMWQNSGAFTNPMSQQQMMAQQQMIAYQQMLAYQQQMMMMHGYRPNPYATHPAMAQQSMPSTGPMANFNRNYAGPQPPNPFAANPHVQTGIAPMPYPPMSAIQPVQHQTAAPQPPAGSQVDQLVKVLQESQYPAQREWAAHSLTNHDWRANPQIIAALVTAATKDQVASVRAGCVYCLGRMGASSEPVMAALQSLRTDSDPRVQQEVEQAMTRLAKSATTQQ